MAARFTFFADRPWARRFSLATLVALASFVLVVLLVRILATTDIGRDFVETQIEKAAPAGQTIRIEDIEGDLLGRFELTGLQVSDAQGLWLDADRIALEWSPMSLLWRHVKIDEVNAGTIKLARRPEIEGADTPDDAPKKDSADRRYTLGKLAIDALVLDEPVAGRAETFQIAGRLTTDVVSGETALTLTPASELGDKIDGTLGWSLTRPLSGTLKAVSPEGGMLRQLLEVGPAGTLRIDIDGQGSEDDWTAAADVLVGTDPYIGFTATGGDTGAEGSLRADLSAFGVLGAVNDRLGGALEAAGVFDATENTLAAEISSPNIGATVATRRANARVRFGQEPIDITFESTNAAALIGTDAVSMSRLSGEGALQAEGDDWLFDGALNLQGLEVAGIEARAVTGPVKLAFNTEAETLGIETSLQVTRLAGAPEALAPVIGAAPKLTGDVLLSLADSNAMINALSMTGAGGSATASGTAALDLSNIEAEGRVRLNEAIAGITISRANWGLARTNGGAYSAALNGNIKLPESSPELAVWTGQPLGLSMRARLAPDGTLNLRSASLKNDAVSLTASGTLKDSVLSAEFDANAIGNEISGTALSNLRASGQLNGPLDALGFMARLATPKIQTSGETIDDFELKLDGRLNGSAVSSRVDLDGLWRGAPLTIGTNASLTDGNWTLADLQAAASELTITGAASGNGADASALQADLLIGGKLKLDELEPAINGQVILASEIADIDLTVSDVTLGPAGVDTFKLVGLGARTNFTGTATSAGSLTLSGTDRPFDLNVPIVADFEALSVELSPEGEISGQPFSTIAPLSLSSEGDRLLASGTLGVLGGTLALDGFMGGEDLFATVDASALDIGAMTALAGTATNLIGTAGLSAEINSVDGKLVGTGKLALDRLRRLDVDVGEVNANFDFDLANETVRLTGLIVDEDVTLSLNVDASSPVQTSASPLSFSQAGDAPLSMMLDGGGPLAPLWNLIGPPETRLEGDFTIDASITGTRADPAPLGRFELRNGVIEEGLLGLRLQDAQMSADLDGDGIEVRDVRATGAKGGTLVGSGRYGFDGKAGVKITLNQLQALQRSDASAVLSGVLEVTGAETGSRVFGEVEIERAEIDTEQLPSGGYTTLDVRFERDEDEEEEAADDPLPILLDISVNADRRIFITGNGLQSEWALEAKIGGTASAPEVTGEANIVRGDIDLIGRNFQFSEATIRFDGDPSKPRLNINADRTSGDLTAGFSITGTPQAPEFELTSSPALPNDEILSRVLFGRSPSELSGFEAAQLASAIAGLSGGGSGFDLIGPLKDALGVDRLDFGVGAGGAPTVGAGKYIANNVYVELRSSTRGAPGVSVEWTPRSNVEVVTDIQPEEAPRFTVQWKRDFDFRQPSRVAQTDTDETVTEPEAETEPETETE